MHYLAIAVALGLSSIAAYFSVLGLAAIFSASAVSVAIMAIGLEATKVVTAVWLHLHWNKLSTFIRIYLCAAVLLLMAITSMGIFGFLSKAHIEYQVKVDTTVGYKLKLVDLRINRKETEITDLEVKIKKIDEPLNRMTELANGPITARAASRATRRADKARDVVLLKKHERQNELTTLFEEKLLLQSDLTILEAEIGPIKYIADQVYGKADKSEIETAVFWLILVLVICFDPLAIALLLGTNIRFEEEPRVHKKTPKKRRAWSPKSNGAANTFEIPDEYITKTPVGKPKKGYITIPDSSIMKIK